MSKAGLYFHTLRQLQPRQIGARLWLRLHRPAVDMRPAPPARALPGAYREPILAAASLTGPHTFRLLNHERHCAVAADWQPSDADNLWVYNLHYFDDLNALGSESRGEWHRALLARWTAEVAPGEGAAWEPYPVSRRIVNWIKWSLRGNRHSQPVLDSLAAQARWLMQRLEYHLLGNHLFANAKALLHAGLHFEGPEAESWRRAGMRIIERELREQVLDDGGHFELSTMYHAAMLEDVLDLVNLQLAYGLPVPSEWPAAAGRMRRWLQAMVHPDGEIAFFNDSAFGIAPQREALEQYAHRLALPTALQSPESLLVLGDSGYVRMRSGAAYLLCDCGPVGPSYLPGHAHADTLSFEMSLGGQRVFVNSGTSTYQIGAERQRQRGTAAHNTVIVDDEDSSEVWAGFRVARRARAVIHDVQAQSALTLEASHDGYRRLAGRNRHVRRWTLETTHLRIEDRLTGAFRSAYALLHLHPEVRADVGGSGAIALSWPRGGAAAVRFQGAAEVTIENTSWHPAFGVAVANRTISARFAQSALTTLVDWAPPQ